MSERETIARIIFDKACGPEQWGSAYYAEEKDGCYDTADAILAALAARQDGAGAWEFPAGTPDYWREVVGGAYTPVKLGKHQASHPVEVKRILDQVRGTETADVIVSLIFWSQIVREREAALIDRIKELQAHRS